MITNDAELYLKGDGEILEIPVLPEKIEWNASANHSSVTVSEGEIQLKQGRKLRTISFSSFFPDSPFQGSSSTIYNPKDYVSIIKKWINDKTTVKFVLTRVDSGHQSVSLDTLITSFSYYEEGGDVGTIQYTISFKEYRKVSVNKVSKKKKKKSSKRSSSKKKKKTYTVKKGDDIQKIAKKELGDSSKASSIYTLNKSTIEAAAKKHGKKSSSKGHYLYAGTVLKLPSS